MGGFTVDPDALRRASQSLRAISGTLEGEGQRQQQIANDVARVLSQLSQMSREGTYVEGIGNPWVVQDFVGLAGTATRSLITELGQFGAELDATAARQEQLVADLRQSADWGGMDLTLWGQVSKLGGYGTGAGIALDIAAGNPADLRRDAGKVVGGLLMAGVTELIPGVGWVAVASVGIYAAGTLGSLGQDWLAGQYTGATRAELLRSGADLSSVAANADKYTIGTLFDDVGTLAVDGELDPSAFGADLGTLCADTGGMLLVPVQAGAAGLAAGADDIWALEDSAVQNLPLPESFKSAFGDATAGLMDATNNLAQSITAVTPSSAVSAVSGAWASLGATLTEGW